MSLLTSELLVVKYELNIISNVLNYNIIIIIEWTSQCYIVGLP